MISIFNGRKRKLGGETAEIYAQIGVNFREHLHYLKGAKLHVFLAICLHANKNGWAWPSVSLLAKETGYNLDTINEALKELCALTIDGNRLLLKFQPRKKENGRFHSNHYLIFPSAAEVQEHETKGLRNTIPNLPSRENPVTGKPLDKENPSIEVETTKLGANAPSDENQSPALVGEALLDEYFPREKKERKPITSTGDWVAHLAANPWLEWGARSQEAQTQLRREDGRREKILMLGYQLDVTFGLRPVWDKRQDVKSWFRGLAGCLDVTEDDYELVLEAARTLRGREMSISDPWSLQKTARALAAERRSEGGPKILHITT